MRRGMRRIAWPSTEDKSRSKVGLTQISSPSASKNYNWVVTKSSIIGKGMVERLTYQLIMVV